MNVYLFSFKVMVFCYKPKIIPCQNYYECYNNNDDIIELIFISPYKYGLSVKLNIKGIKKMVNSGFIS